MSSDVPLISVAVFVGTFVLNFFLGLVCISISILVREDIIRYTAEMEAEIRAKKRRESENSFHFYNNDILQPVNTFQIDTDNLT